MKRIDLDRIESLDEALKQAAAIAPDQPALRAKDGEHSFGSLDASVSRIACALAAAACSGPRQVGYLGANRKASVELMFGVFRAGAVWTPLNGRLSQAVLCEAVSETEMRICFADAASVSIASKFLNAHGEPVRVIDVTEVSGEYERFLAAGEATALPFPPQSGDIAAQIYTSGTSGVPKGVLLSHAALLASRRMERAVDEPWSNWLRGEVNLVCMPNFHVSGALSVVAGVVNLGCTLLLPQFEVGAVLDVLSRMPPARLLLVPSAIKLLLDDPRSEGVDFSRIRFVLYGGSPMPAPLMVEIRARIDCEFVQFYGMTETAGRATYLPAEDHRPGPRRASAGKPFPGVKVAIRDESGQDLAQGAVGEICLSSPSAMSGYWARPAETEKALHDGWYRTGDVGHLEADGYLYVVDRLNDKIVTGGENVYPSEVEGALCTHSAVADAAVCALPDPRWIEAIYAAVVLQEDAAMDEAELRAWVTSRIGGYKSPKRIVFVQNLPRGATGKVLRKDVAALVRTQLGLS